MIQMVTEIEGVRLLESLDEVPAEVSRLRGAGVPVTYDIETTGLDPLHSRQVALIFKPKGKKATIIDVRHFTPDQQRLLGSMLEPLFDGTVQVIGHNLKFDLEFALAQMGFGAHKVYDTMLAEMVILGLGRATLEKEKIGYSMAALADRYGLSVHKEERKWFVDLDTRVEGAVKSVVGMEQREERIQRWYYDGVEVEDLDSVDISDPRTTFDVEVVQKEVPIYDMVGGLRPWNEPFPVEQIIYMKQDVVIPHLIKDRQLEAIEKYNLYEVIDLEMRALLPLVGIEVFGVEINREGWLQVIDEIAAEADRLERILHLGVEGEFDGLDVHILKVRHDRYMEKWVPYKAWMEERDKYIADRKKIWDATHKKGEAGWGEEKKQLLEAWYGAKGKLTKPPENTKGVNLGSWMQVRDGFNDILKDEKYWIKATSHPWEKYPIELESVNEESLIPYVGVHPLIQVYIDYSHARKIVTVYGRDRGSKKRAFIELLDGHNRLRAEYEQIGADTGRMSSRNPNFQQIAAHGIGSRLRENVVASAGHVFVVADFSNIELRILAEVSGDPFLLQAFASGVDVHSTTAALMFGLTPEQTTKAWTDSHNAVVGGKELVGVTYRAVAKTINYMLLYGAGPGKLASELHIAVDAAKQLMKLYRDSFAVAIKWLRSQGASVDYALRNGKKRVYSKTLSGRRRWYNIPPAPINPANGSQVTVEAMDKYREDVREWEKQLGAIRRQLANSPIQGLSADITKLAAALWYEETGYDENMKLVALIHDEDIVEVKLGYEYIATTRLEKVMYQAMRYYLKEVDLGEIKAVVTPYWMH